MYLNLIVFRIYYNFIIVWKTDFKTFYLGVSSNIPKIMGGVEGLTSFICGRDVGKIWIMGNRGWICRYKSHIGKRCARFTCSCMKTNKL